MTELIVNGVKEIVKNYAVDGIHFDDYFYPTTNEEIDEKSIRNIKAAAAIWASPIGEGIMFAK